MRLPSGEVVTIAHQSALRLILVALAREQIARPGQALSREQMLAAGWPGERMTRRSGGIRVRVTVSKLRSMGLRELIVSREDGYLLRPDAVVMLAAADVAGPADSAALPPAAPSDAQLGR